MNIITRFLIAGLLTVPALLIAQSPVARFSASDTAICGNMYSESFTDQSTNNPTSWKWYFPGATPDTSTLKNPTNIIYKGYGCYTVKLVVQNNNGIDSLTDSDYICLDSLPHIIFTGPNDLCQGHSATITVYGGTQYQWNTGATTSSIKITGVVTETYTVKVTSGVCYKDTSFTVHVDSMPHIHTSKIYICVGDSTTIYALPGNDNQNYTYLWNTGSTADSIIINGTKPGSYTYNVTINKGSGCPEGSQIIVIVQDCTGIENYNDPSSKTHIYPNPNNGVFMMQTDDVLTVKSRIEVYDVLGQQVYQSVLKSDNTEVNLCGQPNGIYLYRVITELGNLVGEGKIVLQH